VQEFFTLQPDQSPTEQETLAVQYCISSFPQAPLPVISEQRKPKLPELQLPQLQTSDIEEAKYWQRVGPKAVLQNVTPDEH
jgi:hypothetical protein